MRDSGLVAAYWKHYQLQVGDRDARQQADEWLWATEAVDAAVRGASSAKSTEQNEEDDPVALLIALADAAPDEEALAYLGAGPVENCLVDGAFDLDRVEAAARQNERFRAALRCAWFDERLPADLARRLRRFGPPL